MATQMSPFYANYSFHLRTNWPVEMESKNPTSKNYAHWMKSVHELCVSRLTETRERMSRYYDRSHKDAPPYSVGDLVRLNGKHIRTRRAAKKLDAKLFGPFKVTKLVDKSGMSVELELPKRWRVHNVFHTSLLEPYRSSVKGLRDEPNKRTSVPNRQQTYQDDVLAPSPPLPTSNDRYKSRGLESGNTAGGQQRMAQDTAPLPEDNHSGSQPGSLQSFLVQTRQPPPPYIHSDWDMDTSGPTLSDCPSTPPQNTNAVSQSKKLSTCCWAAHSTKRHENQQASHDKQHFEHSSSPHRDQQFYKTLLS